MNDKKTHNLSIDDLERNGWIIFKAIVGSHAYGTSNPNSDTDFRGIYILPMDLRLSLLATQDEVGHEKPVDIKYYELAKYLELAMDCNPNIIEYLFMPDECIQICTPAMQRLLDNRHLFVSKKAYHTFSGYAYAQIKKAKGENKWVNNPQPEIPPRREQFCRFLPKEHFINGCPLTIESGETFMVPARSAPIQAFHEFSLKKFHCAAQEYMQDVYRLYYYGDEAKGVFRDGNLVCESIPLADEMPKFAGFLIYNPQQYQEAMADWKNYWTWKKERNPNRWIGMETGAVDYDVKNMQHCVRLLLSGKAILETGAPIIRFTGEQLKYLRDIRDGRFTHEHLMKVVDGYMAELKELYTTSKLPHSADKGAIDKLYRELIQER